MRTISNIQEWRGAKAVDTNGDKVGTIDEVYLDRGSQEPEWVTVSTGLFGTRTTFVPIGDAQLTDGEVRLSYTKDQIKDAPNVEADGALSQRRGAAPLRALRPQRLRRLGRQRRAQR